jgi:hypothetical protein
MLISPEGPETILGTTPRMRSFEVVAVFEIGMSEYDSSVIYMPLDDAQEYFMSEDGVTAIELMVDDPDAIDARIAALRERVGPGLYFVTWKRANQTFFSALEVERNVMFLILTLIILVAALNIISGLIMLVKDKGRDIAILRTMGATRGAIMRIFFMTGAAIGIAGTLAGLLLGIVVIPQRGADPAVPGLAHRHRAVPAGALLPVPAAVGGGSRARPRRWCSWRWRCRSSPRSIPPARRQARSGRGAAMGVRNAAPSRLSWPA